MANGSAEQRGEGIDASRADLVDLLSGSPTYRQRAQTSFVGAPPIGNLKQCRAGRFFRAANEFGQDHVCVGVKTNSRPVHERNVDQPVSTGLDQVVLINKIANSGSGDRNFPARDCDLARHGL